MPKVPKEILVHGSHFKFIESQNLKNALQGPNISFGTFIQPGNSSLDQFPKFQNRNCTSMQCDFFCVLPWENSSIMRFMK